MDDCSRGRRCKKTENGTQRPHNHHQLLHRTSAIKIGVARATNTKKAILPVLSTNIVSANGLFKCENVLLDSGAQISLIRQETAETLGLNGKDAPVTIIKVGGGCLAGRLVSLLGDGSYGCGGETLYLRCGQVDAIRTRVFQSIKGVYLSTHFATNARDMIVKF